MVSVIIPFFNAMSFIRESVRSASKHKIVSEIVVVYDGCSKTSIEDLSIQLDEFCKVKLIQHEGGKNLGAGASRNLGIYRASNSWIAFLDADDYFLDNRFDFFQKASTKNITFDGVYEAAIYERSGKFYNVSKDINPSDLLHYLIRGTYGHFCTNGIIVKKELCLKAGMFNDGLELHEDSEFWLRLAYFGQLIPGSIHSPVAVIRKHDNNRIWNGTSNSSRLRQWIVTWKWAKIEPIGIVNKLLIIRKLIKYKLGSLNE